ncbi:hypothetical protein SJI00_14035 [Pseudomonas sp. RP23018S]|uniref:hypothetical protein n=1 Tax=Pseudomonas sp. RP23018S TaxID=3096037 RepID=UPI002ACA5ECD|nr:hypothetical protein [Pseudomonas sp. RP23018S]MDZ5603896.1 hypothetical protein [Pseudomonas sp. RP23018S]
MRDDDDIHEPEHDHLLDREFFEDDVEREPEADAFDAIDEEEEEIEEEAFDHPAWHDDPDD